MTERNEATLAQIRAAAPDASTWLSANAGSGKTRVLTDRVARLLLSGADPRRILCLTYTKAAAGEMQNRLFRRLGEWAMLPDDKLRAELDELGIPGEIGLPRARRLFASAIETPGGLKIQTIHSFCAALLRRFPLEAGVSPQFTEMDETSQRLLMAEVAERLADGEDLEAVDALARHISGDDFDQLTARIAANADAFPADADAETIRGWFGLRPEDTPERVVASVFHPGTAELLRAFAAILDPQRATEAKGSDLLSSIDLHTPDLATLAALESIFLTGPRTKTPLSSKAGTYPTKDTRKAHPELCAEIDDVMDRVEAARETRVALAAAEKTAALHRFARAFLPVYEAEKAARGWLSFDDLIARARALLENPGVAAWVLYRLDGGIDHVLVDEAQDTSPAQWAVIGHLVRDLVSGRETAGGTARTLFVVGDKKQSIYSFQGADAESFDRMRAHFGSELPGGSLNALDLVWSFRSSAAVLNSVDRTFASLGTGSGVSHSPFFEMPGRVDLWPLVPPAETPAPRAFEDPLDIPAENHATIILARQIAGEIARLLEEGTRIPTAKDGPRPLTPGDILILVRKRGGAPSLFDEIIRALKAARLPVAGADRLKLRDSIAVKDILALLNFLALPEDSLSLAAALRSPLLGWSESALYDLAQGRTARLLWQELRDREADHPETLRILRDLRAKSEFLRPYDLIERILGVHDGRRKLLARLGAEAEDSIDELLNLALAYERTDVPSLTGFLAWIEAEDTEIKRQLESAGGRIRVMTVHGAKGLEAPMVILPDTVAGTGSGNRDPMVTESGGPALWRTSDAESPSRVAAAKAAAKEADERERERLLYVAMTRAESWLVVCGAGKATDESWYAHISNGLAALDTAPIETEAGEGRRFAVESWPAPVRATEVQPAAAPELPAWCTAPAPTPAKTAAPVSPSALEGEKALTGDPSGTDPEAALRRGRQLHLLLEHLPAYPPEARQAVARGLLSHGEDVATETEADRLAGEVSRLIDAPALRHLFVPDALAEVALTATLPPPDGRRIHGTVDRLLIEDERILVVDYKSNALVPTRPEDTPAGLLAQLGAYRAALLQIYPGHRVDVAILWTATAELMEIPHDLVTRALASSAPP